MILKNLLSILFIALCSQEVFAEKQARYLLGVKTLPSNQTPNSYGSYAKGCLAGGEEMLENGPTWQVMRLSRGRNWGHPNMISFLKRFSKFVAKETSWEGLYIGDISQPRGGPMLSGHVSHQVGLDADIWMLPAHNLKLSKLKRESVSSIDVRSKDRKKINKNWTKDHMKVLKIAANDPIVERIFITAPAKIYMCKNETGNKDWLQKIRPYWGHNFHFHVRLKCPEESKWCEAQKPTVHHLSKGGNGCDNTLRWWVTTALEPVEIDPNKIKPKPKRHPKEFTMSELPKQCTSVLNSK